MTYTDGASDVGRNRLLLERLRELETEVEGLRSEITRLKGQVSEVGRDQESSRTELRRHGQRLDALRLDRQLRSFPGWLLNRFKRGGRSDGS